MELCDVMVGPDNPCILWKGHRPVKSPSGPHAPRFNIAVPKPDPTLDPHSLAAQLHEATES